MDNRQILILGTVLTVLGLVFFLVGGCRKPQPVLPQPTERSWIEDYVPGASDTRSVFVRHKIQKAQKEYQTAYLELISNLSNVDVSKLSQNEQKKLFDNYVTVSGSYQKTVGKIREEEEQGREKCFSVMRMMISKVMVYDSMTKKKMFRYSPEKLVKLGIVKAEPECPRDGKYGIFYKNGTRTFFCTVHGKLKRTD